MYIKSIITTIMWPINPVKSSNRPRHFKFLQYVWNNSFKLEAEKIVYVMLYVSHILVFCGHKAVCDLLTYWVQPSMTLHKDQLKFHNFTLELDISMFSHKKQSQKIIQWLVKFFIVKWYILIKFGQSYMYIKNGPTLPDILWEIIPLLATNESAKVVFPIEKNTEKKSIEFF